MWNPFGPSLTSSTIPTQGFLLSCAIPARYCNSMLPRVTRSVCRTRQIFMIAQCSLTHAKRNTTRALTVRATEQAPTAVHFGVIANSIHHPPAYAAKPKKCRHLLPYSRIRPLPVHYAHPPFPFEATVTQTTARHLPPRGKEPQMMPIPTIPYSSLQSIPINYAPPHPFKARGAIYGKILKKCGWTLNLILVRAIFFLLPLAQLCERTRF